MLMDFLSWTQLNKPESLFLALKQHHQFLYLRVLYVLYIFSCGRLDDKFEFGQMMICANPNYQFSSTKLLQQ